MPQRTKQPIAALPDNVVDNEKVHAKQEDCDDHHGGGRLHFLERGRGHFLHFGADVVVKRLDPLRPGLNPLHPVATGGGNCVCHLLRLDCHHSSWLFSTGSRKTLAGAEGFEPPSSVLETDSLTVELTPLASFSNFATCNSVI